MDNQNRNKKFFIFVTIVFALRLLFSISVGLIDDEAYHWSWTKDLMLSYYDHPAMIAWLESISTHLLGDTLIGVRLPSFLCYLATVVISFKLCKELLNETSAKAVVILFLFTPIWGFGGFVASPETPFMLCWILAAWVFWQGVREDNKQWSVKKTWLWLGILMGLGLNSKFIIALIAPGFGIYLLMTPNKRKDLLSRWPWIALLLATLIAAPIFLWNYQHDWPGFRYQFHDRHTDGGYSPTRWIGWFITQMIFYSPAAYVLFLLALPVAWARRNQAQYRFIFALAIPSILIFYPQPLMADHKPHWAGAAHLLLAMIAAAIWSEGLTWNKKVIIQPMSTLITKITIGFLVIFNLLAYTPFIYPWMPKVFHIIKPQAQWNTTWDLSNEFFGWNEVGEFMLRRQREIHSQTGEKPFLAALRYETTAQAWWGTKQKIYTLNLTKSHYTVMHRERNDWDNLRTSDALIVTTEKYPADPLKYADFDSCSSEEFKTYRSGEHSRTFTLWWCRRFHGTVK